MLCALGRAKAEALLQKRPHPPNRMRDGGVREITEKMAVLAACGFRDGLKGRRCPGAGFASSENVQRCLFCLT